MKLYRVNGITKWYADGNAPEGAELIGKAVKVETKAETKVVEPSNKAVEPKNKALRGSKKK